MPRSSRAWEDIIWRQRYTPPDYQGYNRLKDRVLNYRQYGGGHTD